MFLELQSKHLDRKAALSVHVKLTGEWEQDHCQTGWQLG